MSDVPDKGSHVGQLSADGQLIWDGQAWQPVVDSTPPPVHLPALPITATPARESSFGRTAAVAVAALVIGGLGGFTVGSNSSQQSLASAYQGVLNKNGPLVADAFLTMGSQCTGDAVDLSRCRAAAVSAQTATQRWLSDLGGLSVPACLAPANQEVDTALVMYMERVTEMIAGLEADNEALIAKGAELANRGVPHLNHAAALIKTHPCRS
jgi:hypothetical protein